MKVIKLVSSLFLVSGLLFCGLAFKKHLSYRALVSRFESSNFTDDLDVYGSIVNNADSILQMKNNFLLFAATSLIVGFSLLLYMNTLVTTK